jgi:hypothetical protein
MRSTVGGRYLRGKGPTAATLAAMSQQPPAPSYAPLPPNHPQANAGWILGMVGTALPVVGVLAFVAFVVFFVVLGATTFSTFDSTHQMVP